MRDDSSLRGRLNANRLHTPSQIVNHSVDAAFNGPIHSICVKFSENGFSPSKNLTLYGMDKFFTTTKLSMPKELATSFKNQDEYYTFLKGMLEVAFENLQKEINAIDNKDLDDFNKDKEKWFLARDYHKSFIDTFSRAVNTNEDGKEYLPFASYFANGGEFSKLATFSIITKQHKISSNITSR